MKINRLSYLAVLPLLACGCVSSESPYRDPGEVRGTSTDFTSYDFQQCAVAMVDSMLSSGSLDRKIARQFPANSVPLVAVLPVSNHTYKIFDLRSMTVAIETRLSNSEKFEFVDRGAEQTLIDDKLHDADSPLTGDAGVTDFGNHQRTDYILTGELNEIREKDGRTRESYYKLTMKLLNKKTGKIDWSDEKELRKVSRRPAVGW